MRHLTSLLLLIMLIATAATGLPIAASAEPPNLLSNASFEAGSTDPANWISDAWVPVPGLLAWDNTVRRSGEYSVRIQAGEPNDARWLQTVAVEPHTEYRLSGYIRTQGVTPEVGAGANLSVYGTWQRSAGLFGEQDWTLVSLVFMTGAEHEVTVAARLGYWTMPSSGTAWFDDLRLQKLHTPTTTLDNAGFEQGEVEPTGWGTETILGEGSFAWDSTQAHSGTRSARVSLQGQGIARWRQTVLVAPDSEYELSGWVKTSGIADPPGQWWITGARLGIYGQDSYLAAATPGSHYESWTYVSTRFVTGRTTRAMIVCSIGDADTLYTRATSSGTAWCDDIQLTHLRTLERRSIQGRYIGLDVYAEDFLFADPERYVSLVDEVYLAMADLVGDRPFNGELTTVRSDASMYYGLLAGNPVIIGPGRLWADIVNTHGIDFGVPHELGHNFDIGPGASYYMGSLSFHNAEHWANLKVLYAYDVLGARYPELTNECFGMRIPLSSVGTCYAERARAKWFLAEGSDYTTGDNDTYTGMLYELRQQIGWGSFKCAFRAYLAMGERPVPADDLAKLQLWVNTLSRCAGRDLAPYYREWGYPVTGSAFLYLPLVQR